MTTPTPAQIAEGRDEALDHLGIDPRAWDRLPGETQHDKDRRVWSEVYP